MRNILVAGQKPISQTSSVYLKSLKRVYGEHKGGYLGILDPFASGLMIIAFGQFSKLLSYLPNESKVYRAVLWLGLESLSLDIENIKSVQEVREFTHQEISEVMHSLVGTHSYIPPRFSAKKVQGKRAYDLARAGIAFSLKSCKMSIYSLKLLHYMHPFITFEARVSPGTYIRSIGDRIARELGVLGGLCSLERIEECGVKNLGFEYELDPLAVLRIPILRGLDFGGEALKKDIQNGKRIHLGGIEDGSYILDFQHFFSLVDFKDGRLSYKLNGIYKC